MIVKGTEIRRNIDVSIDEYEALKGLACHFGCSNPLETYGGCLNTMRVLMIYQL